MIPGRTHVFECPQCKNYIAQGSIITGNTFGGDSYSDGKIIAPMMPEFPRISKCEKCNEIFWLNKDTGVDYENETTKIEIDWDQVQIAGFLSREDYIMVLEKKIYQNKYQEAYIRQMIWWDYNDRVRNNEELFTSEDDKTFWEDNLQKFLLIYEATNINQKIVMADAYRSLGKFDECLKVVRSMDFELFKGLKKSYRDVCKKQNTLVFKFITKDE